MDKYDPDIHHRRSIRLPGFDYTQDGAYSITICTHEKQCLFGDVIDGKMLLNRFGTLIYDCWIDLASRFQYIELDEFITMPNHVHGIILIRRGKAEPCPLPTPHPSKARLRLAPTPAFGKPVGKSVSSIIGSFKSTATRMMNAMRNTPGAPLWQRNYYEHIIRDDDDMNRTREYIIENPLRWYEDENNPSNPPNM